MGILYLENEAVFKQKIRVQSKNNFGISDSIEYTACLNQYITSAEAFLLR